MADLFVFHYILAEGWRQCRKCWKAAYKFLKKTLRNHFDEIEQKRKQQSEIKFQKVVNKHTEEGKYEELPLMSDTTVRKSSKKSMFPYITTK